MYFSFCLDTKRKDTKRKRSRLPLRGYSGRLPTGRAENSLRSNKLPFFTVGSRPTLDALERRPGAARWGCFARTKCPSLRSEADLHLTPRRGGQGLRGVYACAGAVGFTGSARRLGRGLRGGYTCAGALGFTGSARPGGRGLRGGYACAGAVGFTGATRPAWQCVSPGEVPHPRRRNRFLLPCGSWRGRRSICRLPPRRRSQSVVR